MDITLKEGKIEVINNKKCTKECMKLECPETVGRGGERKVKSVDFCKARTPATSTKTSLQNTA